MQTPFYPDFPNQNFESTLSPPQDPLTSMASYGTCSQSPIDLTELPQAIPPTPSQPIMRLTEHQFYQLSPLSSGGFLYQTYFPNPNSPAQPPIFVPPQPDAPHFSSNSPQFISTEIAARQQKLERYREKRTRRNFNRQVDPAKSERACARSRDINGHFVVENKPTQDMLAALEASQNESRMLQSKLSNIEQELALLRQKAEEASYSKLYMLQQLEAQQKMNQQLIQENSFLWATVPVDEIFNTTNQNNPPVFVDAFKQKIDFANMKLNYTDSPHLEAARAEDLDFEARWDEMEFFFGESS
eukprot:TRINITY_DN3533_c0_g1_i1.p1 TRINITY_DN3533_c0_g1~~TRINITY_DN3533_c0_g1_i1.p1  ORF type:complete len:300 (-),score=84.38 TRINITY_DN3533_c0_g1_i1:306-1205(-)